MGDILKTLPSFFARGDIHRFTRTFSCFYFSLGRGRPKQPVERIWFVHRRRIVGHFTVREIVQNVGQLPRLRSMDGGESEWQIKPDAWVAICPGPFSPATEKLFHAGFRGWRYFDLEKYRGTLDARVPV